MKLLVDVNVLLDLLLEREPWAAEAARLLAAIERGRASAHVAGHTITTAYYIIAKVRGRQIAAAAVSDLLRLLEVIPVEKADLHEALALGLADLEDAVQAACARKIAADVLVTRSERDFQGIALPVQPPGAVLAMLS